MRKLLFILSFIPFIAYTQPVWQQNNLEYGHQFKGLKTTRALLFPLVQTTTGQGRDTGAVYYKMADSSVYVWTGSQWRQVAGSSGADSSVFATRYYTQQTFVPYTGATGSVNLGLWGLTTDRFVFNQTPTLAGGERIMRWNDTDGTLDVGMKGGNVTLQVGQELHSRVRNNTGSTITNGQVVYISGSTGTNTTIALARADAYSTSQTTIGIATEDIPNGQSGFVTTFGKVRDIPTTGLTEGSPVYLSSTVYGGLTSTAPTGDTYPIMVGICERTHAVNGVIFVHVDREFARKYQVDTALAGKQGALTLTTTGSSGASTLIGNTLNIPQYSGGGSADSTYQTVEIGTAQGKIGTILYQPFSGGSLPSGWTKGADLTTDYTGGKVNIIGGTYWGGPTTNSNSTAWLSGMQYDTERMPWEKQSGEILVVPQTKSTGAIVALTHGSNGSFFTSRETIAWDLSNGSNSGRVALGTDSLVTFTTLADSTEKMAWGIGDSLKLYWEKDGWNVTAGIINKTTGRKTAVKFGQTWNGIGGRFNFVFLKGTYDVTLAKVDANDRVGGTWFVGHSRASGSGATSEQNRYANLVFNSNYKYFGVMGLPAISSERFLDEGITEEVINHAAPEYVILDLFSNDIADAGRTPAQIKVYADSIGSRFDRAGADVNILGQFVAAPPLTTSTNILNDSLYNLCVERGWTFIDIDTALLGTNGYIKPQYSSDGVHYNDSGNVIINQKIRAKIGYKIFQEVVADTTYKIKFHGLEDATFKNGYKVLVADHQGRVGTVPNQFLNPSQYIPNQYASFLTNTPQKETGVYTSNFLKTQGVFLSGNPKGLQINFGGGYFGTAGTAAAVINITNAGQGGGGNDTAFDNITGTRIVKILATSTINSAAQTISGNDIVSIQSPSTATLTGSNAIMINTGPHGVTSGGGFLAMGLGALKNITTANNFISLTTGTGTYGPANVSNFIYIGDPTMQINKNIVAGDIVLATPYGSGPATMYVGGKANAGIATITASSRAGESNATGYGLTLRSGESSGTGNGGIVTIQTTGTGSSGSAANTAYTTYVTVAPDSVQIDGKIKFNDQIQVKVTTGISASSDYTVLSTDYYFELPDLGATAAHNCVLPTNSGTGRVLKIVNLNNGANKWTFTGATVTDAAGAAITTLTDQSTYTLTWNGSLWRAVVQ